MLRRFLPASVPVCAGLVGSFTLWAGAASASERAFVYTQQSQVLAPGSTELEPWLTFRVGRDRYFSRLDGRLELEHGLAPSLQLALYMNFKSQTKDVVDDPLTGSVTRVSESEFSGASLELKYQLTDPVADALGSALYLETTLGPSEAELEAKLIFDKALGPVLLAANLIAEYELEFVRDGEESKVEKALVLEPRLAAAYSLSHAVKLGLELRAPFGVSGESKSSTLFGGPVVSYAGAGFWAALCVLPQLVAFSEPSPDSALDLDHHERLQVRIIAGFTL